MSSGGTEGSAGSAQVIPDSLADMVERPLYAHLATVRPDGTPQGPPSEAADRIAVAIRPQYTTTQ